PRHLTQQGGPVHVVPEQGPQLGLEGGVLPRLLVGAGELLQRRHEGLGHPLPAGVAEIGPGLTLIGPLELDRGLGARTVGAHGDHAPRVWFGQRTVRDAARNVRSASSGAPWRTRASPTSTTSAPAAA